MRRVFHFEKRVTTYLLTVFQTSDTVSLGNASVDTVGGSICARSGMVRAKSACGSGIDDARPLCPTARNSGGAYINGANGTSDSKSVRCGRYGERHEGENEKRHLAATQGGKKTKT
jgi:hypothetical protein